jgi:hypothetical protein
MKLRYILLVGLLASIPAILLRDLFLLYVVIFGCSILFSLRCIDIQIGQIKGAIPPTPEPVSETDTLLSYAFGPIRQTLPEENIREVRRPVRPGPVVQGAGHRSDFNVSPATFTPSGVSQKCYGSSDMEIRSPSGKEVAEFIDREAFS